MREGIADAGNRRVIGMMNNIVVSGPWLNIQRTRNQRDHQQSEQKPTHRIPPSSSLGPNAGLLLLVVRVWSRDKGESFAYRARDFAYRANTFQAKGCISFERLR